MDKTQQALDVLELADEERLLVDDTGAYCVKDERAEVAQPLMPEMNPLAAQLAAEGFLENSDNAADVEYLEGRTLRWVMLTDPGFELYDEWQ